MTHDALCPYEPKQSFHCCTPQTILCLAAHTTPGISCQCDLIAKVRDDEQSATVESAVYVASQFGAVPELVQLLSRLYEAPEVQMDDEVRREAARELTRMAQEDGLIP